MCLYTYMSEPLNEAERQADLEWGDNRKIELHASYSAYFLSVA